MHQTGGRLVINLLDDVLAGAQSLRSRFSVLAPSCRGCRFGNRRYVFQFAD